MLSLFEIIPQRLVQWLINPHQLVDDISVQQPHPHICQPRPHPLSIVNVFAAADRQPLTSLQILHFRITAKVFLYLISRHDVKDNALVAQGSQHFQQAADLSVPFVQIRNKDQQLSFLLT